MSKKRGKRRLHQTTSVTPDDFIRGIRTRAVLMGPPRVSVEGETVVCQFNFQNQLVSGSLACPTARKAEEIAESIRKLYQ